MGPPGVGKGTQARLLSSTLSVPAISTGDMFRRQIRDQTALGRELQALIDTGEYVPDDITTAVLADRLAAADAQLGFILDGYPRTRAQIGDLDKLLSEASIGIDRVFVLAASRATLISRLTDRATTDGRSDDSPDVVLRRLQIYERETAPIVEEYGRRGLIVEISGEGAPERVAEDMMRAVGRI